MPRKSGLTELYRRADREDTSVKRIILDAMKRNNNVVSAVSDELGVGEDSLKNWLKDSGFVIVTTRSYELVRADEEVWPDLPVKKDSGKL